jgi:hypothetical protein
MKIKLGCYYFDHDGKKRGEPGDEIEISPEEAKSLLAGGSADIIEPPSRAERKRAQED